MKKLIVLLFIAVVTLISCEKEVAIDYAIVKGEILDFKKDKIYIGPKKVQVGENGSFLDTIQTNGAVMPIYDGNNFTNIYLEPGNELTIHFNTNDFLNTLTFSGEGSQNSDYLTEKLKSQKKSKEDSEKVYLLVEESYRAEILKDKEALVEKLNSYKDLAPKLLKRELRFFHYEYLNKLIRYEGNHRYLAKKNDFRISKALNNEINDELGKLDFNLGVDYSASADFRDLISSHFGNLAVDIKKKDSISWGLAYLKAVSKIANDTVRNPLAFQKVRNEIKYVKDLDLYYNTYIQLSTDEHYNKIITKTYNQVKTVQKGLASPKFNNYENNAGGTTSLDDFKGKYVYIDVWATWCGPCKGEIPFLEKVAEQYHGKNIEFVSVSVDKNEDHDKWKKMIKDKQMKGVQLLADKQFKSEFVTAYLINAIPRFILIDPKGNIVEPAAPAPSNQKLITLFNELGI